MPWHAEKNLVGIDYIIRGSRWFFCCAP